LREYLLGQADLGVDEVILPFPLPRATTVPRQVVFGNQTPEEPEASDTAAGDSVRSRTDSAPATPGPRPVESGDGYGLFASLSQALSGPGPFRGPEPEAAARPRVESALPAFAGLAAYWSHLEAHPGAAAGDPTASGVRIVKGLGPAGAALALVGLEPDAADAAAGSAFQGEAGILLDKMLKAIRLEPGSCYKTLLVKGARSARASRRDQARLLPWLHAELGLAGAPFVLLLGEACAQAVLKTGKSLEELRQEPFRIEGREFAATYHPADLLAREELKRKAWEDLQWLRKRMGGGA
jgi:uracil-DNA glycosylase family 4